MTGEVVGGADTGGMSAPPPLPQDMASDLVEAWAELSNVHKSKTVQGSFSYSYADLADVLDVVRPVLARHNLAVIQPLSRQGGPVVTIHTMIVHASGHVLSWEFDVQVGSKAQETGSALTYGRRYALSAVLGVAAGGDDDGAAASSAPPESFDEARLPPSREQLSTVVRLFEQLEIMSPADRQTVIAAILDAPERPWKELSRDEARDVIAGLTERVDEEARASVEVVKELFDE